MAVVLSRAATPSQRIEPAQIAERIKEKFPEEVVEIVSFRDQVSVIVRKSRILGICRYLHDDPEISCDHLQDLTAVDYKGKKEPRFEVVYNLYSIRHRHAIRIRAQVPENDTSISSTVPVWAGVDWHERECFDMFGITFAGHPDLRRILMPEDWEGHPLRKDYPLKGYEGEQDWKGFTDVVKRSRELKDFDWQG
jgi:NADH-quinone oxidoreductase subunit C